MRENIKVGIDLKNEVVLNIQFVQYLNYITFIPSSIFFYVLRSFFQHREKEMEEVEIYLFILSEIEIKV